MDTTKEKSELEDLFSSFNNYSVNNTGAVGGALGADSTMVYGGAGIADTITLSPTWTTTSSNITVGSSIPNITIGSGSGYTYANANWNNSASGQINLDGDNADIKINGKSLVDTLTALEQRLNILTPNPKLESDWDELRELGERYRALEKQCEEKAAMWEKLKSMPAPDIT
jgi:hypothetical protein